ncbi:YdcF family protein [Allorhodopirellula solitaria]|uniref:YdcF family protein n=1 Tax=Allorhodopirellula solitaria TaxID=2527987 RepID=UPI001FE2547A|nr:ElyC/SanA/YdcF family protein [Allorhodopirellula solitaria]
MLFAVTLAGFLASSSATVRGWVITPLYVHDPDAAGEIAYVMADGPATWERLRAAADLFHMHRIEKVGLLNEQRSSGYNFVRKASDTRLQREIDFLAMLGVPASAIVAFDADSSDWLSSRSEAVAVHREWPGVKRLVVVTSPPHTRRSRLCFERVFPAETSVVAYSATAPAESAETYLPIWVEYVKLTVYWLLV